MRNRTCAWWGWWVRIGMTLGVALALGVPWRAWAHYNAVDPYEQYAQRIQAAQAVSPVSDAVFGDRVSLYDGATTFAVTDVSLPGNDALPVAVSRELAIRDLRQVPSNGGALHGFGDWSLDVPYIWGTFTWQDGWTLGAHAATDRCSDNTGYVDTSLPIPGGTGEVPYEDVWNGDQLHIPGAGDQALLANTQAKAPAYASAGTYKWVTTGHWKVSCLASVTGMAGEGFVAVSPAGVRYTFNYAVTVPTSPVAWQYNVKLSPEGVARENIYLLATTCRIASATG